MQPKGRNSIKGKYFYEKLGPNSDQINLKERKFSNSAKLIKISMKNFLLRSSNFSVISKTFLCKFSLFLLGTHSIYRSKVVAGKIHLK